MTYTPKHDEQIVNKIVELKNKGVSSREIASSVLGRETAKSTVNDIWNAYCIGSLIEKERKKTGPNILLHDIETAPTKVFTWGRFKQNIGQSQVIRESYTLCWAAQWLDKDEVMWDALDLHDEWQPSAAEENDFKVVESLWKLYDEADIVIGHNSKKFDVKKMNARFAYWGLQPPSPYRQVDTLQIAKNKFAFPSNRLDSLGKYLGVGCKVETGGFELWNGCMNNDKPSWKKMVEYNIQDIHLLREVYMKLRQWDSNHPNVAQYYNDSHERCTVCGDNDLKPTDKYSHTNLSTFDVLTCNNCGHMNRRRVNLKSKEQMSNTLMNA